MRAPDELEEPVEFDPDALSPASARALRKIQLVWLATVIGITVAFAAFYTQTRDSAACVARRYAWDIEWQSAKRQNQQLPVDGLTGDLLRVRVEGNRLRAQNLVAFADGFGRPQC